MCRGTENFQNGLNDRGPEEHHGRDGRWAMGYGPGQAHSSMDGMDFHFLLAVDKKFSFIKVKGKRGGRGGASVYFTGHAAMKGEAEEGRECVTWAPVAPPGYHQHHITVNEKYLPLNCSK